MIRRVASGGAVTLLGQGGKAALQTAGLVVLSRLLAPSDFGTFAIVTAIVALGELFRDFGLTAAAIQAKKLSQAQASNVFWVSASIGIALFFLSSLASPYISIYFQVPVLSTLLPVTSLVFVLYGCQAMYQVRLARALKFKALAVTDLGAHTIGFIVALLAASSGAGVWSLAYQLLSANLTLLLLRLAEARWLPSRPQPGTDISNLIGFGVNLLGSQLLTYLSSRTHTYAIGLQLGSTALGLYDRAYTLVRLPVSQLLVPLTNVVLPVLSRSDSREQLHDQLFKLQVVLGSVATIVFAMVVPFAKEAIQLVLGPQWLESARLLQILAIGGIFSIFSYVSYWAFLARGLTRSLFRYNLGTKLSTVALIVGASHFGLNAVAIAYATSLLVSWPVNVLWLRQADQFPARRFLSNGAHILASGALASAIVYLVKQSQSGMLSLVFAALLAFGAFVICLAFSSAIRSTLSVIWSARKS